MTSITSMNDEFRANLLAQQSTSRKNEIVRRYEETAPILMDRLHKLYGHQNDHAAWLARLSDAVGAALASRPDELQILDASRSSDPTWFMRQEALGYCAYVDRFAKTLSGVKERIPHLQELGITYLHLLPFLQMRQGENDGGFAVASFDAIEPALGTMEDLRGLTTALRQAGISLCSDFVLNHVADTHPWALAAKGGNAEACAFFHTFADRKVPDVFEKTLVQIFPQAAPGNFTYDEALNRWVWTTFYPYQWDLNYSNPEVFLVMIAALLHLANQGIEVFRLDSTAFLWKREGTNGMNQPEAHWILQAMRAIVDIVAPGVLLKAEAIVPTSELPSYVGGEHGVRECHLAYHSTLMSAAWAALAEQDADLLRNVIRNTPEMTGARSWLTYVRCHDDIGWNVLRAEASPDGRTASERLAGVSAFFAGAGESFARGVAFQSSDPASVHGTNGMTASLVGFSGTQSAIGLNMAKQRMLLLFGLAYCFGGLPLLYMGDELAQENDMSFLDDPARQTDSRWLQRPFLDETAYAARHDARTRAGDVYQSLCVLTQKRRSLPQLAATAPRTLLDGGNKALLAFARGPSRDDKNGNDGIDTGTGASNAILYIGNFSAQSVAIDVAQIASSSPGLSLVDGWVDVLSGQFVQEPTFLSPWSQLWLQPRTGAQQQPQGSMP
ncbi:MAG TPA: alpha-amylase family protein [Burkholderiaceae bacterium]